MEKNPKSDPNSGSVNISQGGLEVYRYMHFVYGHIKFQMKIYNIYKIYNLTASKLMHFHKYDAITFRRHCPQKRTNSGW